MVLIFNDLQIAQVKHSLGYITYLLSQDGGKPSELQRSAVTQ